MKSTAGTTVGDMIDYWEPFVKNPEENVHMEFVNTSWPQGDLKNKGYNKPYDPASTVYAMEDLLLAYPQIKSFIQAAKPDGTRYNMGFTGFLYWDFIIE